MEFYGSRVVFQDLPSIIAKVCHESGPSNLAAELPIVMIAQQDTCLAQIRGMAGPDGANQAPKTLESGSAMTREGMVGEFADVVGGVKTDYGCARRTSEVWTTPMCS